MQVLPETNMRVTVDVHAMQGDEQNEQSSPQSSVIHSVSQSTSPITVTSRNITSKVSPNSAFSTGSSNNNPRLSCNAVLSNEVQFAFGNASNFNDAASSSAAIAQFDIQPLPQLHFVNKLEHNSILDLHQISTSSHGSNNTNMINADSGISNTSPETQSSAELFHPVNYHPSRQYIGGHRTRVFPHIPQSMLSSIPSSASGAIVAEPGQQLVAGSVVSTNTQQSNDFRGQQLMPSPFVSGLSSVPNSPLVVHRCPQSPSMRSARSDICTSPQRVPQSILKANVASMPAVQMQAAFRATLYTVLSTVYWMILSILGILFLLIEVTGDREVTTVYETYYVVLYVFGICFLGYVYVYLIRERELGRRVHKARSFLRTSLLAQRRPNTSCATAADSIALQSFNEPSEPSSCYSLNEDRLSQSRPIDGILIRLITILLGLVCIVYDGLEFVHRLMADSSVLRGNSSTSDDSESGVTPTCAGLPVTARPLLQLCFIFVQLYFIFLSPKMQVQRYQGLARFGLSQMLACNVCIFLLAFVNELVNAYDNVLVQFTGATDNRFNRCLQRRGLIGQVLARSSPYLYYCVVQYNIFAVAILVAIWSSISKSDRSSFRQTGASKASAPSASITNASPERSLVHFYDRDSAEALSELHSSEVHDELTTLPSISSVHEEPDGADSSSSSGMSDSDSEGTIVTTATPPPTRANLAGRAQATSYQLLAQKQRANLRTPLMVEQASSSTVTFTRTVSKEQVYQMRSLDCQGAHRGLFFGLFVLVVTLVNILVFHVLLQKEEFVATALTVHYVAEIGMHSLSVAAMIVGFYKMQDMLYLPRTRSMRFSVSLSHSVFNDTLLLIGQAGVLMLICTNFVSLPLAFEQRSLVFNTAITMPSSQTVVLFIGSNIVSLIQSVCQTVFIVTALRRMSYKMLHKQEKPGRDYVTFLILYNLSMFLVQLFELRRLLLLTFTFTYFGILFWLAIVHISIPLVVFYRLQSTLCLIRVWKAAYKFKSY